MPKKAGGGGRSPSHPGSRARRSAATGKGSKTAAVRSTRKTSTVKRTKIVRKKDD